MSRIIGPCQATGGRASVALRPSLQPIRDGRANGPVNYRGNIEVILVAQWSSAQLFRGQTGYVADSGFRGSGWSCGDVGAYWKWSRLKARRLI